MALLICKTYETLLKLQQKGLIRVVGVSNFQQDHLEDLKKEFGEYPVYDQIQVHPWGQQRELCNFCRSNGIAVAAWGPLMHGFLKEETRMAEIAKAHSCSEAQAVLRWHLQKGNIVLPKSVHENRIIENADVFGFALTEEEMQKIDALERDWHWGPDAYTFHG